MLSTHSRLLAGFFTLPLRAGRVGTGNFYRSGPDLGDVVWRVCRVFAVYQQGVTAILRGRETFLRFSAKSFLFDFSGLSCFSRFCAKKCVSGC